MAAIFSHRATLHKVCAVLPQERTGFSMSELIATLEQQRDLPDDLLCSLLETDRYDAALFQAADRVRRQRYGTDVFVRGLIEFTNYCRNDCYYCGIRRSNAHVQRYRLTPEEILAWGTRWGSGHLSYRAAKMPFSRSSVSVKWFLPYGNGFRTVPLRSLSESGKNPAIGRFSVPVQTGICCGMKPQTRHTIAVCTPSRFRLKTGNAVCLT